MRARKPGKLIHVTTNLFEEDYKFLLNLRDLYGMMTLAEVLRYIVRDYRRMLEGKGWLLEEKVDVNHRDISSVREGEGRGEGEADKIGIKKIEFRWRSK